MKYRPLRSLPSAVQVWFEEQLEALGVDSALYTRYILSLMYADPSDIINAEDDIIAGLNQEGNKRLRRAKSWRKYTYVDADEIKRSAVVECLMTAAEQTCEVEALVDQLCEKLREVHSESDVWPTQETKVPVPDEDEQQINKKVSPTELAQKYYAAFPPLSQKSDLYFSSNISLVLDKWPSDKSNTNLISAKWTPPGSSKKSKRRYNNNQPVNENTMKTSGRDNQNRNRFGHKRTHCGRDLSKEAVEPSNRGNFLVVVECTPPNQCSPVAESLERDRSRRTGIADTQEGRMKLWLANAECKNPDRPIKKNMVKRRRLFENNNQHPRSPVPLYSRALWSLPTEDLKRDALARYVNDLYSVGEKADNQPFTTTLDIEPEISALREEYQRSPARKLDDDEDEIAIKEEYKRPRQRVSNQGLYVDYMERDGLEEKAFNDDWDDEQCDGDYSTVQFWDTYSKARSILLGKMGDLQKQDVEFMKQRRINDLLEELEQDSKIAVPTIRQRHDSHPRDAFHPLSLSLLTINHSSENSAFCEYRPSLLAKAPLHLNPFNSFINQPSSSLNPPSVSEEQNRQTHFQPLDIIIAREERKKREERKIKDGTTFDVQSSIDEVKFKRSDSGMLYLQTEFGEMRRYYEFKMQTPNDELLKMPKIHKSVGDQEFHVKFWVSQNDKACQTDDPSNEAVLGPLYEGRKLVDTDLSQSTVQHDDSSDWIPPPPRPEELNRSNSDSTEVGGFGGANKEAWGDTPKSSSMFCKHCIVNHPWPANLPQYVDCDLKHIWAGTEKSGGCPWRTIVPTPEADRSSSKLREEIRVEAERLLSDLNSLHLSNLGSCRYLDSRGLNGSAEKIRRHSFMDSAWSFASLLQEDRLVSLPTFPSRRSVTL